MKREAKPVPHLMKATDQHGTPLKGEAFMLPAAAGACPVCARNPAHLEDQPHDAQSLFYQYAFYGEHGRWPTWKDALAHCSDEVKQQWETALREGGHWTEP